MRLAEIWRRWKPDPVDEVSFAGIVYVIGLVPVLLLVHLLQPEPPGRVRLLIAVPNPQGEAGAVGEGEGSLRLTRRAEPNKT
jgi:hypothetical protein